MNKIKENAIEWWIMIFKEDFVVREVPWGKFWKKTKNKEQLI